MNINFWMLLWKGTFIFSILVFIVMFVYVSIKGYKELKNIFFNKN